MPKVRLSTGVLLVIIIGLGVHSYRVSVHEARLHSALASLRNLAHAELVDELYGSCEMTVTTGRSLEQFVAEIHAATRSPRFPKGIPVYVDPIGLQESGTRLATVTRALTRNDGKETLGDYLTRALKPPGLGWKAENGLLFITSAASIDPEDAAKDPEIVYRDVLP